MCLTLDALIVFLNLIGPDIVTSHPGQFVVHAAQGQAVWVETAQGWCTDGPQIDQAIRFETRKPL